MYHMHRTGRMILAVYDGEDLPHNRLGVTPETHVDNSDGWQTINLASPVYVRGGQTIWLAWVYEYNPGIAYFSESGLYKSVEASPGGSWIGGMPEQFGSCFLSDYIYSIYATYTPD
jgi:hypothetical protein